MNAIDLANVVKSDLMYLDPPYNGRQYMSNYHLLETIAKYDYPTIKGVTGMRVDPEKMSDPQGAAPFSFWLISYSAS